MSDKAPIDFEELGEKISQEHAHEVLTPLTIVRGRIQLALRNLTHRDGPKVDRAVESLTIADRHVAHAAHAVHRKVKGPSAGQ